jgi:hypothetical protein
MAGALMFSIFFIVCAAAFVLCTGSNTPEVDERDYAMMRTLTWIMTLLPTFLYLILELVVWRAKKNWVVPSSTPTATSSTDEAPRVVNPIFDDDNNDNDEESQNAVPSQGHQNSDDTDSDNDDQPHDDSNIEMPEIKKRDNPRHPSMIKTPSSRPPVSVSTLTKNYEN